MLTLRSADGFPISSGVPRDDLGEDPAEFLFFQWDGNFSDGTIAPNGDYRLAFRSLKILAADYNSSDSWETFISPTFMVARG